ncbi:uncharacterized protein A1O5_09872 [Cladophialophora psammophila CBS 110553]|uniref:Uncharacterized protein n=1 Tax=Cladophialophora psammophila CBS 110553 TaxID=1182543 RepID=W9WQE9_9EURO|nr:uncharacterized protein A1O5_09872 [Cladophialophora psammophila CBS 110553]EXJ67225.1 hypothetical protein A1O5_09872 [Cladophialophora psammophila CBS 110553]
MDQGAEYAKSLQHGLASLSAGAQEQHDPKNEFAFELVPSQHIDELTFPTTFHFQTPEGAIFHTWSWTASLIIGVCMTSLCHKDDQWQELDSSATDSATQNICMSYEYAANLKPLGAQFLQLPLICAFFVCCEEVKNWILRKINLLVSELHIYYTREFLEPMAASILGNLG